MAFANPPDDLIRAILARPLTIALVGCSPDPLRDSHRVARLLIDKGHNVVPVNPRAAEILGRRSYASLREVPQRVDMVDIFRRSEEVPAIVAHAIDAGVKIVWMQLGVIDESAARRAASAGLTVIMDRCPAIEYQRLFGRDD